MEGKKAKPSTIRQNRYNAKTYDQIKINIRKSMRMPERIAQAAVAAGQSKQAYIIEAINRRLYDDGIQPDTLGDPATDQTDQED